MEIFCTIKYNIIDIWILPYRTEEKVENWDEEDLSIKIKTIF